MEERKLATVCRVEQIVPIDGADRIELARVRGWQCVVGKGEFQVGDCGVYFEIDSMLPLDNPAFNFLIDPNKPTQTRKRLRTKRCLGQISQGLLMPLCRFESISCEVDTDLTEILDIEKYEPNIPAQLQGLVRGNRPWFVPKTDEERVQNIPSSKLYGTYEITEKLDGSSMSVYCYNGDFGVCSRNMDMMETETNSFWRAANQYNLRTLLTYHNHNLVLQGELVGEGIQGNRLKIKGIQFRVFNIYLPDESRYMGSKERKDWLDWVQVTTQTEIPHVPIVGMIEFTEDECPLKTIRQQILDMATAPSAFGVKYREGIVFKRVDGAFSFKAISNEYLLKYGD